MLILDLTKKLRRKKSVRVAFRQYDAIVGDEEFQTGVHRFLDVDMDQDGGVIPHAWWKA